LWARSTNPTTAPVAVGRRACQNSRTQPRSADRNTSYRRRSSDQGPGGIVASVTLGKVISQPLRYGAPEEAGMSSARVRRVAQLAGSWVAQGMTPALVVLIARRGIIV